MSDTQITVIGNLTADPELRFTPNGAAVCNFRIAATPRRFDKQAGEWVDGEPMYLGCAVWKQYAENAAETLRKGMHVIVQGRLKSRTYDDKDGQKRTVFEVDVDEVGPTLRFATATVNRASSGGARPPGQQQGDPWAGGGRQQPAGDPWAAQGQQQQGGPWQQQEAPF